MSGDPATAYRADRLGTTRFLTNSTGARSSTYEYDAYGVESTSGQPVYNPFRFTGQQWDAHEGHLYLRNRLYYPALGRFLVRDPIRYEGGTNLYAYCGNNPVNCVDPSGLEPRGRSYWDLQRSADIAAEKQFQLTKRKDGIYHMEVLVSAPLGAFASQWGHVATRLEGTVFSEGQTGTKSYTKRNYLDIQRGIRDTTGYEFILTESEYRSALQRAYESKEYLNHRSPTLPLKMTPLGSGYNPWNQCTTVGKCIVEAGGVQVDTTGTGSVLFPAELEAILNIHPRLESVNHYPQEK